MGWVPAADEEFREMNTTENGGGPVTADVSPRLTVQAALLLCARIDNLDRMLGHA